MRARIIYKWLQDVRVFVPIIRYAHGRFVIKVQGPPVFVCAIRPKAMECAVLFGGNKRKKLLHPSAMELSNMSYSFL